MQLEKAFKIIKRPYLTEKTYKLLEKENKIVFVVDRKATKKEIKEAIELLFNVKVVKVNTMTFPEGKKAYVKLSKETPATELASKLGLM